MPLLRKKLFHKLHVSSDFRDDDEVFHCEATNEIFKDYNEFCERIILCNSLVWSCSITGKPNFTYQEALLSEENARKSLKEFPMELRIPILYLASKTNRTSLNEMVEDVYQFARDRYFVGEMVEASFTEDSWCECHVLQVIEPTKQQINSYAKDNNRSMLERQYQPPAKLFRYEVEQFDCGGDTDVSQLMIVEASQVRRRKQHYSRERNKIFLRQLCEQGENGIWMVKESVLQKYGIHKTRFDTIFAGPMPDFSPRLKKPVKHKQESIAKFLTPDISKHRVFDKPDPLKKINDSGMISKKSKKQKMNGKFKEDLKAKALEEKARLKEARLEERGRKKEEKQKLAAYMKEWNKPREDLECEDLRQIPDPTPVKCFIPNDKFGDFVMILEFLQYFYEELEVGSYFPGGVNLDLMEKALLEKEVAGPWSDLLQLLLANIFKFQAEEEDEIHADAANLTDDKNIDHGVSSMAEAVKLATIASSWCQTHHGCQLAELTLDYVTLSEILRQHLLSSGGRISDVASKWRYSQRGGYTNHDDPVLLLRMKEAHILRTLGHMNVCEFELDDRLKVVSCLINQLLTFASIRDVIDERYDKLHQAKKELKLFLIAEQKKEKEEREKMKEREKEGKVEEEEQKPKKLTRGNYEDEKKKEEYENKLKELQMASRDDQMMLYLGSDRAHRRYWRFLSIPGLFVENDERWPGACLPEGTPYKPELQDESGDAMYAYLKKKFKDESSDKENSIKELKKSPKKVAFSDKNGLKSPRKDLSPKKEVKMDFNDIRQKLNVCTGDKNCPIHCATTGPQWSFYGLQENIDSVINALNKRGIREGELRQTLMQEATSLTTAISECPRHKLNPEVYMEPIKEPTNKNHRKNKYDNVNLAFPPGTDIEEVLELTLRDYILDLEDKIKVGCLGSLKVISREVWRTAINKCGYDKQCDKLVYGLNDTEADTASNLVLDKIKNENRMSRPGTPDSEISSSGVKTYRDPGRYLGPPSEDEPVPDPNQQISIKQLACAILQISHAIEPKYLKKPLGVDDKDKKPASEDIGRDRWEQSLMASTSWSQLFVHLSTLENSIAWARSALNAQCRICRKRRDAENMLLCDGCNKGHHLYCLKPKLNAVPEGDWFCTTCKPRETKPKEKSKRRKKFEDEVEEEAVLTKETRRNRAKRIPESEDEEAELPEDPDATTSLCSLCGNGGRVICCDGCPKVFHLECTEPPLKRVPRGKWLCHFCLRNRRTNSIHALGMLPARGRERERDRERVSAAAARSRIHGFAKSLLTTESTDWDESSVNSDDFEPVPQRQTRRSAKRVADASIDENKEDASTVKGCMATLQELLADITHHRDSWPFLSPVTKDEVPDYHDIISCPMDFGTIKYKLGKGDYQTLREFYSDCILVFDNCEKYNQDHSSVYKAGTRLLKYFEKRCKDLGLNYNEQEVREPDTKKQKSEPNGELKSGTEDEEEDENLKDNEEEDDVDEEDDDADEDDADEDDEEDYEESESDAS
ncbi:bromodomain adjacent to zinc finger domain protein 1A isoform X3 [Diprion similis]|uniref:bromodomain adjacent to zinc finger domain protein 1A isoform X3 n=1 Tax=Diprion similis TaxID=362088 RepID=UPI001EF8D513|nr:bromodomain adjacent to zinc finger domain protein 1A isoform X3 [Diprion similis]